ncbi:MAG: hypothetical protein K2Y25_11965, partial [Pseudomonadaceae bacterium]|nr:hypothetical protein [Pseudomonadaceae bacterium]
MINLKNSIFLILLVLAGCQTTPTEPPKTREQIKAEIDADVEAKMITEMKLKGKTQEEINHIVNYLHLPYKKQLESQVADYHTTAGNMLALLDHSYSTCKQTQESMNLAIELDRDLHNINGELSKSRKADLSTCAVESSDVIREFYYKSYYKKISDPKEYEIVNDTYVKWTSYMREIMVNPTSY